MATAKEINKHLKLALDEVGEIKPWYDRKIKEWVFSHPLYPVEYGGSTKQEVVKNYPKYLREFIKHRLNKRLERQVESKTKGRGGARLGAGRPKGTLKGEKTAVIRLKVSVAEWVKAHEKEVEEAAAGRKKIVPVNGRGRAKSANC
ncbi:MAG: hypothetical protein S4CHLAM2_10230 [Chlamydiales bacterium]|nr:hypothetical protein [Chlamydiales bacterium]